MVNDFDYYNFLTTPSGRYCRLFDLNNGCYLTLVRFLESQNYLGFFDCLNNFVVQNIPDFDTFNIVDKCYVYIAICMYSVRGVIEVNNDRIGSQYINLSLILNNIENSFKDKVFEYQLKRGVKLYFKMPSRFSIENNVPSIDWFSGLYKMNDQILDAKKVDTLKSLIKAKDLLYIEESLRQFFDESVDLFDGVPMNEMKIYLCSESLILNAMFFYRASLEGFYQEMYGCCKHLKMSFDNYMSRSHVETDLFISFAAKENEEMSKNSKSKQ